MAGKEGDKKKAAKGKKRDEPVGDKKSKEGKATEG